MELSVAQTFLGDILHTVSQALLAPDIILLLLFIGYALFSIGSVVVEFFTERKHFKVVMPRFLAALIDSTESGMPQVIEDSGLLNRQKEALSTVFEYRRLPGDALVALVRRLVSEEETRYDRITGRNNTAAKVAPMLGLMGTLIPLGPGIQALGQADTAALSSSLLIAFDTTVAGLVTAAVCLVIGKIRSNWYNNYLSALDAAMATMLEKIELSRAPEPKQEKKDSSGLASATASADAYASALASATATVSEPAPAPAYEPAPAQPAPAPAPEPAPAPGLISEPAPAQPAPSEPYNPSNFFGSPAEAPQYAPTSAPAPASDVNSQMSGYSFLFERQDDSAAAFPNQGGSFSFEPNSDPLSSDGTLSGQ